LSTTVQETDSALVTSTDSAPKALDAEEVTTIASTFLKRIGHRGSLNPKRVSVEEDVFTVEIEMKKFTATVKISALNREIREYDVQPKSEEAPSSFSPKLIITVAIISVIVSVGLYFGLKMLGI
jgi:imidazolonepropionase-like amidohydrolase